jgi:hypothetical protein
VDDGSVQMWHSYLVEPDTQAFEFEKDKTERLFILTWPDERTERFRDCPVRHLGVDPDFQTGEVRPEAETGTRLDNNSLRPRFIPRVPVSSSGCSPKTTTRNFFNDLAQG